MKKWEKSTRRILDSGGASLVEIKTQQRFPSLMDWQASNNKTIQTQNNNNARTVQNTFKGDILDTDYNTDNWEPGIMTIFVTWQLIVTLDIIRNSCDVFIYICNWWFNETLQIGTKPIRSKNINTGEFTMKIKTEMKMKTQIQIKMKMEMKIQIPLHLCWSASG